MIDSIQVCSAVRHSTIPKNSVVVHRVTDIDFLENSRVVYRIVLEEQAQYKLFIMLYQVSELFLEIEIDAQGDQVYCEIIFLYALASNQKITIITKQKHSGKKTVSKLYARGIVKDTAVVHHQGCMVIYETAQKSEASFEHKALIFNGSAQVVLEPSIEVLQHDVQCMHGAAVGQFQEEQVWYLTSRGFDEQQVYKILVKSFFGEFIEKFDQSALVQFEKVLESLCQKVV